jgi:hypothetical protein
MRGRDRYRNSFVAISTWRVGHPHPVFSLKQGSETSIATPHHFQSAGSHYTFGIGDSDCVDFSLEKGYAMRSESVFGGCGAITFRSKEANAVAFHRS